MTVQIDLELDDPLLERALSDPVIMALIQVYGALDHEDCRLRDISIRIWNMSGYADRIWDICQGNLYDFNNRSVWVYEFRTSVENAYLVRLAHPVPKSVKITEIKENTRSDLDIIP